MPDRVHVAVAVIVNRNDEVCISLRHQQAHQGGRWEFPGGKVENKEVVEQALVREIREELALEIIQFRPLISIAHDYHDKSVYLHVYKISSYRGEASGLEGQQVKWVPVSKLHDYRFPDANVPIIKAIRLPDKYLITGKFNDADDFAGKLKNALQKGIRLVQLRLKENSVSNAGQANTIIRLCAELCSEQGAQLMLNLPDTYRDSIDLTEITFSGFHLDSKTLNTLSRDTDVQRGEAAGLHGKLLSASCHNMDELKLALRLQADFVVLSPVQKTSSHPDMDAMGWEKFSELTQNIAVPVYALGGVSEKDMETAWQHGAQGISAISALWEAS